MWDRFILICSTTSISRSTDCPLILLTPVALQENGNLLKPARKHGSLVDTHAENTRESCTPHTFAKSSLPFWSKSSTGTPKRRMVRRIAAPLKRKAKEKPGARFSENYGEKVYWTAYAVRRILGCCSGSRFRS